MLPDYLRVLAEPGRCQKFLDPVYASVPVFPRIVFLLVLLNEQTIWILHAGLGLHAPVFNGSKESGMVAFGLARIVVYAIEGRPAQEDIAGGLHHVLAYYHPLPVVFMGTRPHVLLKHRRPSFFELHDQRVITFCSP